MWRRIEKEDAVLLVVLAFILLGMCQCQFRLQVSSAKAQMPPLYVDLRLPYVAK